VSRKPKPAPKPKPDEQGAIGQLQDRVKLPEGAA